jgi:hypothetical protein
MPQKQRRQIDKLVGDILNDVEKAAGWFLENYT